LHRPIPPSTVSDQREQARGGGTPACVSQPALLSSVMNMWREVALSDDLADGETRAITVDGVDLVLWRSATGRLAACDRRCPHQWADLDAAGAVDGEELVCLSHFWRFDAQGIGSKLSATGRRDEKSPIEIHDVLEVEGGIQVWIQ